MQSFCWNWWKNWHYTVCRRNFSQLSVNTTKLNNYYEWNDKKSLKQVIVVPWHNRYVSPTPPPNPRHRAPVTCQHPPNHPLTLTTIKKQQTLIKTTWTESEHQTRGLLNRTMSLQYPVTSALNKRRILCGASTQADYDNKEVGVVSSSVSLCHGIPPRQSWVIPNYFRLWVFTHLTYGVKKIMSGWFA